MSDPARNLTGTPTKTRETEDRFPVTYNFPQEKPIFWGPGQDTVYPDTYVEPDKARWRDKALMAIPVVFRFFAGNTEPVSPPPPPPPTGPEPCTLGNAAWIQLGYQWLTEGFWTRGRSTKRAIPVPPATQGQGCSLSGYWSTYRYYFPFVPQTELEEFNYPESTLEFVQRYQITQIHNKLDSQGVVSKNYAIRGPEFEYPPPKAGCFGQSFIVGSQPFVPGGNLPEPNIEIDPNNLPSTPPAFANCSPIVNPDAACPLDFNRDEYKYFTEQVLDTGQIDTMKWTIFFFVGCGLLTGSINNQLTYVLAPRHITQYNPALIGDVNIRAFNLQGNLAPKPTTNMIEPPRLPPPPPPGP